MTYATLMTHLDLGVSNKNILRITAELVEHFQSAVIGVNACQPMPLRYGDGGHYGLVDFLPLADIKQDGEDIERYRKEAESALRLALHDKVSQLEWRSLVSFAPPSDYIAHQARAADLLIINSSNGLSPLDTSRCVNIGELVMHIGRPVLLVPPNVYSLALETAVIAWKDTPEARCAVFNALPLLKKVSRVVIVEIAATADMSATSEGLQDVVRWLGRHGISSEIEVAATNGDDAIQLDAIAHEHRAGLMVAGAYGHSRLKEWAFGGVTSDLLLNPTRCTLVSH